MPAGSSALGFGGGFAKGLAGALVEGRRVAREEEHRKEDQQLKEFGTIFPLIWNEAEQSGDYTRANEIVGQYMPGIAKSMKKKGVDLGSIASIAPTLQAPTSGAMRTTQRGFESGSTQQMEAGGPPLLESRPAVAPGTPQPPAAPGSQFLGMPMTTPTQKIESRTRAARRFSQANPDVPLMSAFKMFGLDVPASATAAGSLVSTPGQTADGKVTYAVHDRRPNSPTFGRYLDPDTQEPIEDFVPRTTTGSTSLGADRESISRELFGKRAADLLPEEMAQVNAKLGDFTQSQAFRRGTGTGRAAIQTELDKPIGTTAAQIYNVPPTTTMRQLSAQNALRPEQQEQIRSLGQVDALLTEIQDTLPLVFPDVEPGIWGRLQTQFSLGAQKLGADEDLAKLDAAINGALAQVAQLSGQPGSRLSDRDIEIARGQLAEIKPSILGGDTLATAQVRLGVLRRLLEKAKSGIPSRTAAPAAPGTPGAVGQPSPGTGAAPVAGAPPAAAGPRKLVRDANGNWVEP